MRKLFMTGIAIAFLVTAPLATFAISDHYPTAPPPDYVHG